ncbi:MAG: Maf family nucleotide pyrophosphatase [Bacteroidales bacterium]|nr:Maf family nucleotide pyrophosphatase [Bacteroidales bacterium]MDD4602846.1 Maf family nucleotide pyrophosphatase [Bacteroidales bacterium]
MINHRLAERHIILASQSPRRQYLLKELGIDFEIRPSHVVEDFPEGLLPEKVALFLAELKANSFDLSRMDEKQIIITADTIVELNQEILGKPANYTEAVKMLQKLSDKTHHVITAVCLQSKTKRKSFYVRSSVTFKALSMEEIDYYIDNFQPFDKAGGYGVQEWIGYIGISKIEGSFFNVMGLPVKELYEELLKF